MLCGAGRWVDDGVRDGDTVLEHVANGLLCGRVGDWLDDAWPVAGVVLCCVGVVPVAMVEPVRGAKRLLSCGRRLL